MNHILVVDDDPGILRIVSNILSIEGYEVRTAVNGEDALRQVDDDPPSLVLLDMRMPVMDGWEFARRVRLRRWDRLPILVMTAARDARKWADEINAEGFLPKPFDLDTLLCEVERLKTA